MRRNLVRAMFSSVAATALVAPVLVFTKPVARSKHRGSPCWAGTAQDSVTIKVVARKVRVDGVRHRVNGTLAFARVTQKWLPWMERAPHGVLGAQDLPSCRVA